MRKLFIVLILFFSYSAFSMQKLQGNLSNHPIESAQLLKKYQDIMGAYNNDKSTIIKLENSYSAFHDAIFYPIGQNTNSTSFLDKSREILQSINNALTTRNPSLPYLSAFLEEKIVPMLKNRIDLARLDKNVFDGYGSIGGLNNFKKPHLKDIFSIIDIQNAMKTLTGRIFQVELIEGVVHIDRSSILDTSSGTMINFNKLDKTIEQLPFGIATNLNSVLTCAHSLSIKEGRAKFYFVPTSKLDLTTGFPIGVNKINGNNGLIHFLEINQNAYPLDSVHIKNSTSNHWKEHDLEMGQPQFLEKEDLIIGHINITNRKQPEYKNNYTVSFFEHLIQEEDIYFSTGYPGCDHYSLDLFKLHPHYDLLQEDSLSPFFITSSIKDVHNPVTINPNGSIVHRCPSSSGMSGGAIFQILLAVKHINIFGVITSGEDIIENGCHWH